MPCVGVRTLAPEARFLGKLKKEKGGRGGRGGEAEFLSRPNQRPPTIFDGLRGRTPKKERRKKKGGGREEAISSPQSPLIRSEKKKR